MTLNYDLIIVGGGFWGTAVYLKAKSRGWNCKVIDSGRSDSGSRNAGALTCKRWYKSDTILKHVPKTWTSGDIFIWIDWLIAQGHIEHTGQWTYNKSRDTWKRNDDCFVMKDVNQFILLAKPMMGRVLRIESKSKDCLLYVEGEDNFRAKYVVVTAGMWTDRILKHSGMKLLGSQGLLGRALLLRADPTSLQVPEWDGEVVSAIIRPYKNFDLLPNNKRWWYWGVTTEKTESDNAMDELEESATYVMGDEAEVIQQVRGLRAVCSDGMAKVDYADRHHRVIAATGGQKVGLGLAGAAAQNVIELIGFAEQNERKATERLL